MLYKTIALQLLEQSPALYERLRRKRMLLPALNRLARRLKASHKWWQAQFLQSRPDSDPSQIASEALEIALKELELRLLAASPPSESETLSLDEAMEFLQHHAEPV